MAWTKVEHDLRDKPEVVAIAHVLQVDDRDLVVGKLIRLWQWFDKNTVDGCARSVTTSFIDAHVACAGFASALESVGWLTVKKNAIIQPNFDRHNSKSAKGRALSSDRMKRSRCAPRATPAQPEKRREEKSNKRTPLPPLLQSDDFVSAWEAWRAHRTELKKPLRPTMEAEQLAMLARLGVPRAVAMIRHTIAMGWQGLREPDQPGNGRQMPRQGIADDL